MHLDAADYRKAYDAIKATSLLHNSDCSIVMFVATPDTDALCACKILTVYLMCILKLTLKDLLTCDYLAHKVVPVGGYDDIARVNEQLIAPSQHVSTVNSIIR